MVQMALLQNANFENPRSKKPNKIKDTFLQKLQNGIFRNSATIGNFLRNEANKMKKTIKIVIFLLFLFYSAYPVYPQTLSPSQTIGGLEKMEKEIERNKELEKRIMKKKGKATKKEEVYKRKKIIFIKEIKELEEEIIKKKKEEKGKATKKEEVYKKKKRIFIKKIKVREVTLISKEVIDKIVSSYENEKLSLKEMQKICDLITNEYRRRGYVTSRTYLPPQTIKEGLLTIMVIEGKLGNVEIKGNRYFRTSLLKKKLEIKPGEFFNYKSLQKSLRTINIHPDRFVKAVLAPGKEPGTTDIVLKVKDNFPFHIGFEYDNFGSRYIEKDRYGLTLEHNNLLGFDDKLYLKYQKAQAGLYELENLRYSVPLTLSLEAGFYYLWSKSKLGKEYKDLDIRGKSQLGGLFLTQSLIKEDNIDLELNLGFDYKHIHNYTSNVLTSRDELRIFKTGFDLDTNDKWGRTILTEEIDFGVPDFLGGVQAKDTLATREGAGGKFLKFAGNLYRLQPMPFSSSILWKNQFQFSNYTLPSCEQFQIGGITNVRGYPSAEYSGDKGYATSLEWSFPPYFLPKQIKVPLSKSNFYNATRIILFYDWATTQLNKELAGEQKYRTLKGWGFGLRFNLPEYLSARVECAYPIGETPSDGNHLHTYASFSKKF